MPRPSSRSRRTPYEGEGWGLCYDGARLVMSDGSDPAHVPGPATPSSALGEVEVTLDGKPRGALNELECVDERRLGERLPDRPHRAHRPGDRAVTGVLDLDGIIDPHPDDGAARPPCSTASPTTRSRTRSSSPASSGPSSSRSACHRVAVGCGPDDRAAAHPGGPPREPRRRRRALTSTPRRPVVGAALARGGVPVDGDHAQRAACRRRLRAIGALVRAAASFGGLVGAGTVLSVETRRPGRGGGRSVHRHAARR